MLAFYPASVLTLSLTWALPDFNRERQISLDPAVPTEIEVWQRAVTSGARS